MRFQPAYRMLEALAASGIMGRLRTISFQNFAQALAPDHWFWDRTKSGGILVEHGVHFFDAYSRIAGAPSQVSGTVPGRKQSTLPWRMAEECSVGSITSSRSRCR